MEFRVAEEDLVYALVNNSKKAKTKDAEKEYETYVDAYEEARLQKEGYTITPKQKIAHNTIYLVSANNSRKVTGSYYTPECLSTPMVKKAIQHQLHTVKVEPLSIRILDNACGSGHILIEALHYLTESVIFSNDYTQIIEEILAEEKPKIEANLVGFIQKPIVDEVAIIKRYILKRCIFGVDYNEFAVEITRLALWLDSFFIGDFFKCKTCPSSFVFSPFFYWNMVLV